MPGDFSSCFRAQMALGPTRGGRLLMPLPGSIGVLGGQWGPFSKTEFLSPSLYPLFSIILMYFCSRQGAGRIKNTFPLYPWAFLERAFLLLQKWAGQPMSQCRKLGEPLRPARILCGSGLLFPPPRTPPSGVPAPLLGSVSSP